MTLEEARAAILNTLAVKTQEHLALVRLAESIEFVTGQSQQVQVLQEELAGLTVKVSEKQTELDSLSEVLLERTQLAQDQLNQERLTQEARLKDEATQANLACQTATQECDAINRATTTAYETLAQIRQDILLATAEVTAINQNLQLVRAERDKALSTLTGI